MNKSPETVSFEVASKDIPFSSDGLKAPTIYVEDIRGMMQAHGVVKMNLTESRVNIQTSLLESIHVATLVIPAPLAKLWGQFLLDHVTNDKKAGGNGDQA